MVFGDFRQSPSYGEDASSVFIETEEIEKAEEIESEEVRDDEKTKHIIDIDFNMDIVVEKKKN